MALKAQNKRPSDFNILRLFAILALLTTFFVLGMRWIIVVSTPVAPPPAAVEATK